VVAVSFSCKQHTLVVYPPIPKGGNREVATPGLSRNVGCAGLWVNDEQIRAH
jgi:hypothetical protein